MFITIMSASNEGPQYSLSTPKTKLSYVNNILNSLKTFYMFKHLPLVYHIGILWDQSTPQ